MIPKWVVRTFVYMMLAAMVMSAFFAFAQIAVYS